MRIEFNPTTARKDIFSLINADNGIKYMSFRCYKGADRWINMNQCVPFVIKNDKMQWKVHLSDVTLLDIYLTFEKDAQEEREGLYIDDVPAWSSEDINTSKTLDYFLKYLFMKQKRWGIWTHSYRDKRIVKEFINTTEVEIESVLQAVFLKNSYTIDSFSFMFGIEGYKSKAILKMLGYERNKNNVVYMLNTSKQEEVYAALEQAKSLQHHDHISRSWKEGLFINIGRSLSLLGDRISYPYVVNMIKDEPVYKKKHDSIPYIISIMIAGVLFFLVIRLFIRELPDNSDGWNALNQLYSTLIITCISSFVTVITTFLVIQRSYKIDYHQERLTVMPVLRVYNIANHFDCEMVPDSLTGYINSLDLVHAYTSNDAMLLCIENIGKGISFNTIIRKGVMDDDEFCLSSLGVNDKRYLIMYSQKEISIKFEFRDIFGNLYYQTCVGYEKDSNSGGKIWFQMNPPELVKRTERYRYVQ